MGTKALAAHVLSGKVHGPRLVHAHRLFRKVSAIAHYLVSGLKSKFRSDPQLLCRYAVEASVQLTQRSALQEALPYSCASIYQLSMSGLQGPLIISRSRTL